MATSWQMGHIKLSSNSSKSIYSLAIRTIMAAESD